MNARLMKLTAGLALGVSSTTLAQTAVAPRDILPPPELPFGGIAAETPEQSTPSPLPRPAAPADAPNILLFMSDDVGFAMSSAFGGPVPTPNLERLAKTGVRYNRFHTTAVCSPSRAALLTGRNHHNAATGVISDMPSDFPGYNMHFPRSTATIAQVLELNGYSTAMFGKHHNIPPDQASAAGPFDQWPAGLGFEYFYGFPSGETDQWHPQLYRGTNRLPDDDGAGLVDKRLVTDAIHWVHQQKLSAPAKPFFIYLAPGSAHAPQQAPADLIARFKGRFDAGWDAMREESYRRQLTQGIIPKATLLTPRPDGIPAWSELTPLQQKFAARTMEAAAAALAYQDEQLGRLLDEIERMGLTKSTLVLTIIGDNGASAEGGRLGTLNDFGSVNGIKMDDATLTATIDTIGGPEWTGNYNVGWGWAMNTPFRWTKQYASMLGGIRNGMIMSWPGHIAKPGSVCEEFSHLVDVAPTLLEAAHLPAPSVVYGAEQKPLDGKSILASLQACQPNRPRTQYFELMGKAGIYHDGWFASSDNGRRPWELMAPNQAVPLSTWELHNLRNDFSQATDLAAKQPDRVAAMIALWRTEARRNNVFPIMSSRMASVSSQSGPRKRISYDFWGNDVSISAHPDGLGTPTTFAGSFLIDASLSLSRPDASGAILAIGSHAAGWSFLLEKGHPVFVYAHSPIPGDSVRIAADETVAGPDVALSVDFVSTGPGGKALVAIRSAGRVIAQGTVDRTWMIPLPVGEMVDSGRDTGSTVTSYQTAHGLLEGVVRKTTLTMK